jgi:hypothetical protein
MDLRRKTPGECKEHLALAMAATRSALMGGWAQVCVPIDPASPFAFDPETVPTVASLLAELQQPQPHHAGGAAGAAAGPSGRHGKVRLLPCTEANGVQGLRCWRFVWIIYIAWHA